MQQCDTLITADWCIPVDPQDSVKTDWSVVVTDGRIVDALPATDASQKYRPGVAIVRPGHVLIPGFVNSHCHAAMTLLRGLADDLPLERWLREAVWPVEERWVSAEFVRDGTKLAIAEMLRAGITCFSDQYFFPEIVAETAVETHIRAMVGTPVIDFKNAWSEDAMDCLAKGTDLVHDRYADHSLISSCFAPHSIDTVSAAAFSEIRILSDQLDCPVQLHLHESVGEVTESVEQTGMRPLARIAELGLLNASLLAVHAVHLTDDEITSIAAAGVSVAHCPRSNLKLADGIAPVAKLLDSNVNVSLGTDSAASNNVLDILGEMRLAALIGKTYANDAEVMAAPQMLRMATLDGASALGLAEVTGSIEKNKWADLVCIDLNRLHAQPLYSPLSQIVYSSNAEQVSDVWVAGRHLLDHGELTHIDQADVIQRASEWQRKIAAMRS